MAYELKKEPEISVTKENKKRKGALGAQGAPPLHFSHVRVPYNSDLENELIDHLLYLLTQCPQLLSTIIGYGTSPAQQDIMLLEVLTHIRLLAGPIHNEIRQKMNEEMRTYLKEKAIYDTLGNDILSIKYLLFCFLIATIILQISLPT